MCEFGLSVALHTFEQHETDVWQSHETGCDSTLICFSTKVQYKVEKFCTFAYSQMNLAIKKLSIHNAMRWVLNEFFSILTSV